MKDNRRTVIQEHAPNKYAKSLPLLEALPRVRKMHEEDGSENRIIVKSLTRCGRTTYEADFPIKFVPPGEGATAQRAVFDLIANVGVLFIHCLYYLEADVDLVTIDGKDVLLFNEG